MWQALLLLVLATPSFSAPIWPVGGWPGDNTVPSRPRNLCQNVPASESECTANPCCVATTHTGPSYLLRAFDSAWGKSGCSATPIVWTKYNADFDDGPSYNIVINRPLILYIDSAARISAPGIKNWPCDHNGPVPFINITADGCAICGSGNGMSADTGGGKIDGGGRANGWYPSNGNCGSDFEFPSGSKCHGSGAPHSFITVGKDNGQVNGFTMAGISLFDAPRYNFVPTGVNGIFLSKVWLTTNLPGSLIDAGQTCTLDGFHFNLVTGAIIDSCTVQSGDDGIVMAYGNEFISVSNCNVFNGHGTTVGQDGLTSNKNYCNQHIAYQHITGVNQRWSLRIKSPMQESYNTLNILYNDYCSIGASQAVSIITEQSSQTCPGKTNIRINITNFTVYTPGTTSSPCPDRLNPQGQPLGTGASTSIWKYSKSDAKTSQIQCRSLSGNHQIVDCGFTVNRFACVATSGGASCQSATCSDSSSIRINYLDPTSKTYFSKCDVSANIPAVTDNKCVSGYTSKPCPNSFLTTSTSVFSKVQDALRKKGALQP